MTKENLEAIKNKAVQLLYLDVKENNSKAMAVGIPARHKEISG